MVEMGINNTNPLYNLDVNGNGHFQNSLYFGSGNNYVNNNGSSMTYGTTTNHIFYNGSTQLMLLNTSGVNVSNNINMVADGTQSIYFLSGANKIGRFFGTTTSMYLDFYNSGSFVIHLHQMMQLECLQH